MCDQVAIAVAIARPILCAPIPIHVPIPIFVDAFVAVVRRLVAVSGASAKVTEVAVLSLQSDIIVAASGFGG